MPQAPMPDLLSTGDCLACAACLERPLQKGSSRAMPRFLDTLWDAAGGFHGHWADDHLDAEYTFYGLAGARASQRLD
jgi:hypothetical protein